MPDLPAVEPFGDDALLLRFAHDDSAVAVSQRVHAVADQLRADRSWLEVVPSTDNLVIQFDLMQMTSAEATGRLREALTTVAPAAVAQAPLLAVPLCYGGEYGPDLDRLCSRLSLTADELIQRHSARRYDVLQLGFTPGFVYLGSLDESLRAERLASPRQRVAAGSVGIAGRQVGIYGLDGPGGWPIIGRTALSLFRPESDQPFVLRAGMQVRFVPIRRDEFERQ